MPSSPAVSLACRDGGAWRAAWAALHGLAAASLAAWLVHPAGALLGLPVMALAWWWMPPSGPHRLAWDGQAWRLDGCAGQARIALDLGVWMLLDFRADQPADGAGNDVVHDAGHDAAPGARRNAWLPLSPAAGAWAPLRAALYAAAAPASARPSVTT
jgi:hypothetical protein